MKKNKFIIFGALLFTLTLVVTFNIGTNYRPSRSIASATDIEGLYEISGRSTDKGDFSGTAWVKNGVVQRLITWSDYRFNGDKVQSIWSGKVSEKSFDFTLTLSNVLTRYEFYSVTNEELKPQSLSLPLIQLSYQFSYHLNGDGDVKETWTKKGPATDEPLWTDLRKNVLGVGDKHPVVTAVAKLAGLYKVIQMYRELPQMAPYQNKPEFQNGEQFFVDDKTDADFYLKNPGILRITNKTLNPLALAEATMRRNAYGHTLAYKANFLGNETITNNLNAAGLLELATVDDNGNKTGRTTEYDSALWTSMFGWAELMRYQNTKDPAALANFKKVLDGILTLVEITGDPTQFARGLAISPPEESLGEGWIQGTGKYSQLKWRQGGNNDMSKGLFMTFALAHQVLTRDDAALIERLKKVSKVLVKQKPIAERGFNSALAKGLDALWNEDEDSLDFFYINTISPINFLADVTKIEAGLYYGAIADFSGIHLSMISNMSQLLIAQELRKVFPYNPLGWKAKQVEKNAQKRLYDMHVAYKNAHRDFLTLITYTYSPVAREHKEFVEEAKQAVWSLKEVPAPRFIGSGTVELPRLSHWSMSSWPRQPWKALSGFRKLKDNPNVADLVEGAYAYPLFETQAWSTTYFWKDLPFSMYYGSNKYIKPFSSDYLMLYWASRSSGIISAQD